ncbi:hypothetical protein [Streptomyces sp. NPDC001985]|uniref:hypothetical protein n=1 Tax=Streptomyces sp. NPDC001985 TaxID=3154406 RepID=UPI00331DB528
MRGSRVAGSAAAVVIAVVAVGCDTGRGAGGGGANGRAPEGLVVAGEPPASPYGGPLLVRHGNGGREIDNDTPEGMRLLSGAAGRALECEGAIYSGGGGDTWSEGDGGATPEEGLAAFFDMQQPDLPRYGYRVEAEADGRVLYSFDVKGRTRIAVVVAEDQPGRPGWGPDTSASCDPAELPAAFTDTRGYEIWTDTDGRRVPVTRVTGYSGAEHCAWEKAHFVELDATTDRASYARDPEGVLPASMLTSRYDGSAALPDDARDTRYRLGDRELWLAADGSRAYVRTPAGVEAWPEVKDGMACA